MDDLYWAASGPKKNAAGTSPDKLDSQLSFNSSPNIDVFSNKIYFYEEVDKNTIYKLNKAIRELNYKLVATDPERYLNPNSEHDHIELYIHSYGGSVLSAFAALDVIANNKIPIWTYVEGGAASAGTILSVVGKKRFISKRSYMLIHQLSSTHWGKLEELRDSMQNSENLMKTIRDIYKEYAHVPSHELDEILKHDLWLDSKKCLEWGLVDEII